MKSPTPLLLVLPALLAGCSGTPATLDAGPPPPEVGRPGAELPRFVDLMNFRILGPGVAGSGQPSVAAFPELAARGYSAVINLRQPGEPMPPDERERAEAAGLRYFSIPMRILDFGIEEAGALEQALAEAPPGSVLIHCASGQRVAALWGMYRGLREGLEPEEAVAAARAAGLHKEALAERIRISLGRALAGS